MADDDIFNLPLEELLKVKIESSDRTPLPIEDVPASVSIISRQEIELYGYTSFIEVLEHIAGLYTISNLESTFLGIRGNAGGRVELLVNGIPQHPSLQKGLASTDQNRFNIPVQSIDRVEVIRGPMSVVYGSNAFIGVINVVTHDVHEGRGLVAVGLGSNEAELGFARYSDLGDQHRIVAQVGQVREGGFAGDYEDMLSEDFLSELEPGFDSSMDGRNRRLHQSAELSGQYQEVTANLRYQKMKYGIFTLGPSYGQSSELSLSTTHVALDYTKNLSETVGIKITGIYSEERYELPELGGRFPDIEGFQVQNSERRDLEMVVNRKIPRGEWLMGYRYRDISNVRSKGRVGLGEETILIDFKRTVEPYSSHELFGQIALNFEDQRLHLGVRLPELPKNFRSNYLNNQSGEEAVEASNDRHEMAHSWRASWSYDLDSQQTLKFLAGTAIQDNDILKLANPEQIQSFEIYYLLTMGKLQAGLSIFENRFKYLSQRELDPETLEAVTTENGAWTSRGVEQRLEYRPQSRLRFVGSLVLQESRDHHLDIRVGYSPRWLLKFRAGYDLDPWSLALMINYVDDMDAAFTLGSDGSPLRLGEPVPAYTVLSANVGYQWRDLYLSLHGTNLLDREIRYPANELTEDFDKGLIGPKRELMLSASMRL